MTWRPSPELVAQIDECRRARAPLAEEAQRMIRDRRPGVPDDHRHHTHFYALWRSLHHPMVSRMLTEIYGSSGDPPGVPKP